MSFKATSREVGDVTVIDMDGRITLGEGSTLLHDLVRESLGKGRKKIVMNLAGINYIDSTGLGTILAVFTTARNLGGNIKLASLAKKFRDQLHQTGLERVFEIYEQVEGAVSSYHGTS